MIEVRLQTDINWCLLVTLFLRNMETVATTVEASRTHDDASSVAMDSFNLDFLVVVTGGSKGIGKACVESFARRGARILFTYCSDPKSAICVEVSFQPAGRVQCRHLDQGDFNSVRAFAAEVDKWRDGRPLAVLVNNAALGVATVSSYQGMQPAAGETAKPGGSDGAIDEAFLRAEEDMALMRVNALGPMWVTEALLPMITPRPQAKVQDSSTSGSGSMQKQDRDSDDSKVAEAPGRKQTVLFVGSVGGGSQSVFPAFRPADAMSKAALAYACKHFAARSRQQTLQAVSSSTRVGANEIKSTVDFVCLCPGATLTDMFKASTLDKMSPTERERFVRALPQGRLIQPEEVGEAVYWMCSCPAASIFHGAVVDASAGLAVRPGALTEYTF